jgi:4'-phosphopantetheinyl transferase
MCAPAFDAPRWPRVSDRGTVAGHRCDLDAGEEARDRSLLSQDERLRADHFIFDRDRARFIAGRSWLRRTLGARIGAPPAALRFRYGPEGRPRLEGLGAMLDFNLSHSQAIGLLVVAESGPLGVDVEQHRPFDDLAGMAEQVMARDELADFLVLEPSLRVAAFYRLWARKEALLKAMGRGFSAEPQCHSVGIGTTPQAGQMVFDIACRIQDLTMGAGIAAALCAPAGMAFRWVEGHQA